VARKQLFQVFERVTDAFMAVDRDGLLTYLNPQAEKMFWFSPGDMIGKNLWRVLPEVAASPMRQLFIQAMESGQPVTVGAHSGARKRWYTHTLWPAADGCSIYIQDVTARRLTEIALEQSELKYRELVESVSSIILRVDAEGRINFINEYGLKFFGYTAEELVGRNIVGSLLPLVSSTGRHLGDIMREVYANPAESKQVTNENIRCNGERVWVAWNNRAIRDANGQVIEILSVGLDVTEQRRAEEEVYRLNKELTEYSTRLEQRVRERTSELAVARDRAEAADRVKSAFLATMSHELRTPLNSIIGFTGLIIEEVAGPINAEQRSQLGMVQSSAWHLLDLINDVLDISRIEAGEVRLLIEHCDLATIVEKAISTVRPLALKKQLVLRTEIPGDIGVVATDPRRLQQIVLNLLGNAIKFTEAGTVDLVVAREDGQLSMRVIDTGIGIQPGEMARLFEPFQQAQSSHSAGHEGTGLGLAICRRLARLLGGDVCARSVWGQGSVFTLTLPLQVSAGSCPGGGKMFAPGGQLCTDSN
jgi:PAS domain S-box-containing protein